MLAHVQLKPFYRLSTRDVTHVRKCTRPSPALPYWKRREAGRGPGNEAIPPPFLHTVCDQKLEAGTAWERGYPPQAPPQNFPAFGWGLEMTVLYMQPAYFCILGGLRMEQGSGKEQSTRNIQVSQGKFCEVNRTSG